MENVDVYLAGVKTFADFEVIKIMDNTYPYPALLGIDWAFSNYAFIGARNNYFES